MYFYAFVETIELNSDWYSGPMTNVKGRNKIECEHTSHKCFLFSSQIIIKIGDNGTTCSITMHRLIKHDFVS